MSSTDPPNGDDSRFRRLIDAAKHDAAPPPSPASAHLGLSGFAKDAFPGCEITGEISRGGQGIVLEALQTGTHRRVAIKVLSQGLVAASREQMRFEQEVTVLAQLKHPNIVTIHDSGSVDGQFYYIMDRIDGQRLDVYMTSSPPLPAGRAGRLPIKETLRLFQKVCEAVNAAHLAGVIHRDLKPGNILVDSKGEPHVLDFGLAKVVGPTGRPSDIADQTLTAHFVGTPQWASPEQVDEQHHLLDTRTDVYSLGVILYHLLTGRFPYPVAGSLREVFESIVRTDPKPPRTLRRQIDHELETIVLKCLSKDRARRYPTAGEVARDIGRFLNGEPIEARSDSRWYIARKAFRKHRVAVVAFLGFVPLLAGSAIATGILYRRAEQRGRETEQVAEFQASQFSDIDAQLMGGRMRRVLIDGLRTALEVRGSDQDAIEAKLGDFEALLADVNFTNVALATLDENILQPALMAIDRHFTDQPLVKARLLQTVADTLRSLGRLEAAIAPQTEALAIRRRELGGDHPNTLMSIGSMGLLLKAQDKLAEAEPLYLEAMEVCRRVLGNNHRDTLTAINNLGELLRAQNRLAEAEPYLSEVLEGRRKLLGDDHLHTLNSLNNMAGLLEARGQLAEAESYLRKALAGYRRKLGDDDLKTIILIHNLGLVLHEHGKYAEAGPFVREALGRWRRILGDDHKYTLDSINLMGELLREQGKLAEAEPYLRVALDGRLRVLGNEHSSTLNSINNFGLLLQDQGKLAEAEPYLREALEGRRRKLGDDAPDTLVSINNLADLLRELAQFEEAERLGAELVATAREKLQKGHPYLGAFLSQHAKTLAALGRFAEAEERAVEAYEILRESKSIGPMHRRTLEIVQMVVDLYDAWHAIEPGVGHDAKAMQWRSKLGDAKVQPEPGS